MKRSQFRRVLRIHCVKWLALGLYLLIWVSPVLGKISEKPEFGVQGNDAILIVATSVDRKARVQLETTLGERFDGFCDGLMNAEMAPQSRESHCGSGLIGAMSMKELLKILKKKFIRWAFFGCGLALFVWAFTSKNHRKSLLTLGSVAIGFGLLPQAMLPVIVCLGIWPGIEIGPLSFGPIIRNRERHTGGPRSDGLGCGSGDGGGCGGGDGGGCGGGD